MKFSNRGCVVKSGGRIDTLYGLGDAVYTHGRSPNILNLWKGVESHGDFLKSVLGNGLSALTRW